MLKDRDVAGPGPGSPCPSLGPEPALCGGCGARISDRFYLLAVDRPWHSTCLKCCECKLALDSELTCFARAGNIYCKEDYYRLFAVKRCGRCQAGIAANELVMRARDLVYHVTCFTCASCGVTLHKGDHFGMRDCLVYCRPHYELLYNHEAGYTCPELEAVFSGAASHYFASGGAQKGRPRKRKVQQADRAELAVTMRLPTASLELLHHGGDLSSSMESLSYDSSAASPGNQVQHQRNKRMRTSFKHHQLRTMKSYFAINQNPDAKDLKQLAQKTGLSKRVLQVWFQNARAKWRRNLMRQEGGVNGGMGMTSGGPPSVGSASIIIGDSNGSLPPPPPTPEEMGHHHTLSFADLY